MYWGFIEISLSTNLLLQLATPQGQKQPKGLPSGQTGRHTNKKIKIDNKRLKKIVKMIIMIILVIMILVLVITLLVVGITVATK